MPTALRRIAWWSFLLTELLLVAAGTAYVGVGTRDFWLMVAAAALAAVGYAVTVWVTAPPALGDATQAPQRWYWF